jgi:uncharacterized protein YjbI with pentapeptide repeats
VPRKPKAEKQREHTERIALELYHNRLLLGKPGDERSDWAKAEKIVRSPIRTTLFASNRPLIKLRQPTQHAFKLLVWDTPKWFLVTFPQLELVKLLAVPLVLAAAGSIITGQIQREANQNAVLKAYFDKLEELTFDQKLLTKTPNEGAIVLARGRTVAALHELDHARKTQLIAFLQASDLSRIKEDSAEPVISFHGQNLSGLDFHGVNLVSLDFQQSNLGYANLEGADLGYANLEGADLVSANLEGADLVSANLEGADLVRANLEGAFLGDANLEGADLVRANLEGAALDRANLVEADLQSANLYQVGLYSANLEGASLYSANLEGASLNSANLEGASLNSANFEGADLTSANLEGASLGGANLEGADLINANLEGADLINANLSDADLTRANLNGATNLAQDQLSLALLCRTTLPQGFTLDPNRDCQELWIDPETGLPVRL